MKLKKFDWSALTDSRLIGRHPVLGNAVVIILIATLGLMIIYFSLALFTKHGRTRSVPGVENMGYSEAVELLHNQGFRVEIRDSLYLDNVRPGFVIEQFPKRNSIVKPGRKIFLYINAVHPKEVVIDEDNRPGEYALKGVAFRQAIAHLEELGFKKIKIVKVLGDNKDNVVKIIANGIPVRKKAKVPVNASIVVEVNDGRIVDLYDSLLNIELANSASTSYHYSDYDDTYTSSETPTYTQPTQPAAPTQPATPPDEPDEEPETIGL